MSIDCMNRVWKLSTQKGGALLVLLAIADSADDDGYAWPGFNHLAKKTRMSTKQIGRVIDALEESCELLVDATEGKVNRYIISLGSTIEHIKETIESRRLNITPDKMSRVEKAISEKNDPGQNVQGSTTKTPDKMSRDRKNTPGQNVQTPRTKCPDTPDKMSTDPLKILRKEEGERTRACAISGTTKPATATAPLDPLFLAIITILNLDPLLAQKNQALLSVYSELKIIGATPDQFAHWHEWWRKIDWRGRKGDKPLFVQILDTWKDAQDMTIEQINSQPEKNKQSALKVNNCINPLNSNGVQVEELKRLEIEKKARLAAQKNPERKTS